MRWTERIFLSGICISISKTKIFANNNVTLLQSGPMPHYGGLEVVLCRHEEVPWNSEVFYGFGRVNVTANEQWSVA